MIDVPVQVKDALKEGAYKKNYRFIVLNDDDTEDFTIDNENLVSESVGIDERMCSGDVIKFGLCEGSSLEFQYFGKQNITGREIQAFIDVDYEAYGTSYHNIDHLSGLGQFTIETAGEYRVFSPSNDFDSVDILRSGAVIPATVTTEESGTYADMQCEEGDVIQFMWVSGENINTYLQSVVTGVQIFSYPIPMGFFTVKNCSRQASTGIIKATCYNKLQSDYLDQKANDEIVAIVAEGEPGISDGMTYYYLMNKLLEDYYIDNRDDSEVTVNTRGEGETWIDITSDGDADIAEESTAFRLWKHSVQSNIDTTEAFFVIRRKSVIAGTRLPSQGTSSATETLPREYNRATFDENIAGHVRDGFESVFGSYQSNSNYIYYLQPTSEDNIRSYFQFEGGSWSRVDTDKPYASTEGTAYTLEEVRAALDSQEMLWPVAWATASSSRDTYIDSAFRGLVAIDRDHTGASGNYPDLRIKTVTAVSALPNYIFPQFITALKSNSTEYYWNEYETASEASACNCAYLVLPTETWALMRETSDTEYAPIYTYPWNTDGTYDYKLEIKHKEVSDIEKSRVTEAQVEEWSDVTLRELQSAIYETNCCFGQLSRETDLFSGVELNHSRLLPQETLYPANDLYPGGAQTSATKAMYSKLWADEGNVHKWRYLIITYKGLDEEQKEKEFTLQRTINADGTDDYNMSDNWLFKNLIWTAEQVGTYADAMVLKMQDITWFPFEMWCAGLPYVETGDEIEIPLGQESYTSYILQRQLKGIQNLQDTYINGTLDIF